MNEELKNIKPIDVIMVTFNRLNFLKYTVKKIYERTKYPHRLWVIDNCSTDDTQRWLKVAKLHGYVHDYVLLPENKGLASGFTAGFEKVKSDYFICTQDDIVPPDLKPCWLERMLHLIEKYPEYGGICMRVQRTRHREILEHEELIESSTCLPSVFRISKKKDIEEIGGFGKRPHWESTSFMERMKPLKKRLAMTTHLYADHTGFMPDNKGFAEGFEKYHTYSKERIKQGKDQPYPEIDEKTNIPLGVNTPRDRDEQKKRDNYYKYWGLDSHRTPRLNQDQKMLSEYAESGHGVEIGPGMVKCHENAIGLDIYPYKTADILGEGHDLWMFKDNELDFVLGSHVLEHFPDTKKTLREWFRVIKPGGIIAVAVPDSEADPQVIRDPHKCAFTKKTLPMIFSHDLRMKVLRVEDVPDKKPGHRSFIVVAKK